MYSKAKLFGHPLHVMLVSFPVAFYTAAFLSYVTYNYTANIFWFQAGVIANIAGVIMGLVAAIPGFIDWNWGIPKNTEAKKTGMIHMVLNIVTILAFAISAWINYPKMYEAFPTLGATLFLTGVGFVLLLVAGFYGWTLVQKYHVGIDLNSAQANLETDSKHRIFSPDQEYVPVEKR